ncbi:hypothetical protein GCM10027442_35850 [Emticicia fontis]
MLKFNIQDPTYGENNPFNYTALDKILLKTTFKKLDYNDSNIESAIDEFSQLDSNKAFLANVPDFYHYGLKINLNRHTNYNDFIHLLSLFAKYKLDRYAFDMRDDKMYIVDIFNIPESKEKIIGCYNDWSLHYPEKKKTFYQEFIETFNQYITPVAKSFNKTIAIYIGFIILIFASYRNKK